MQLGPGVDAQERVLGDRVLLLDVVQVVGRQERQLQVLGQAHQVLAHPALDLVAVVHQLEEVVLAAEDVPELRRGLDREVVLAQPQPRLDLAGGAACRRDEPLAVLGEQLAVESRPLGEDGVEGGPRAHLEQVVHAGVVAGQQRHVGVRATTGDIVAGPGALVAPLHPGLVAAVRPGGDIGLEADDRLDVVGLRGLPELVCPEEVAVVGHRDRRHAHLLGGREHVLDPRGTVEHGVLGVVVQVDEVLGTRQLGHRPESRSRPRQPSTPSVAPSPPLGASRWDARYRA